MSHWFHGLLLAASLLCLRSPIAVADEATKAAAAEARFQEGRQLMEQGRHAEACAKFDVSYQLEALVGTLLNRAVCREKQGQLATAWSLYREAAGLARRNGDAQREKFAREHAAALEPSLRYITLTVPAGSRVVGLTITRNTESVDPSLWNQPIPFDRGTYEFRVTAPGHEPHVTKVDFAERDLEIAIPRLSPVAEAPKPIPLHVADTPSGMPLRRKLALGTGAIAVAGLVSGGLFALRSQSKTDDAEQECTADFHCTARGVTLTNQARTAANLSYVSYGVALTAAVATTVLWLTASKRRSAETSARAAKRPQLVPTATSTTLGVGLELGLQGSF